MNYYRRKRGETAVLRKRNRFILLLLIMVFIGGYLFTVPTAATLQSLQAGMEAPDFSLKDPAGTQRSFKDLRGDKLTVLVFWSTWSSKSATALARMQKLYDKYSGQGVNVIGINVDGQATSEQMLSDIKSFTEKLKITFPLFIDHGLVVFHDYGVIAIPSTVVLDPERVIKMELSGFPLMGSQELVDYISSTAEGKAVQVAKEVKSGYKPDKNAVRYLNMGKNTLKSKRMADTAEMWFKKAIDADPRFTAPHISLGKFYVEKDNIPAAREQFQAALSKEPDNVIAMCELALLMVNAGKVQEGKGMIEKAINKEESYTPCYYYMGYALGKEGKPEEAMKMFDKAAELNPLDYNIYVYKAKVCEDNKMLKETADSYKKALETILR